MIPIRLQMQNWLSYRGLSDVFDFRPIHIACLTGPNGAGKSSFLEAIHWAVWGEARVIERDLMSHGESEMSVEFVFCVNQTYYRINRSYSTSKRTSGTQLSLHQAHDDTLEAWSVLTRNSVRETQAFITDQIVGMSYTVFQNSAYLRQGQANAFTDLSPSDRRNVLSEILEIDQYNRYADYARQQAREHENEIATLTGQMQHDQHLVDQLDAHNAQLTQAEHELLSKRIYRDYAELLIQIEQQRKLIQTETAHFDNTQQQLATAESQRTDIRAKQTDSEHITQRYHELEAAEARYTHLEDMRQMHQQLVQQQQRVQADIQQHEQQIHIERIKIQQQYDALQHNLDQLPTLTQELTHLQATVSDPDVLTRQIADAEAQYRHAYEALTRITHHQEQLALAQQQLASAQKQRDTLEQSLQPQAALLQQIADIEVVQEHLSQLHAERETQSQISEQARTHCGIVSEQGKELKERKQHITIGQPCPTCQTMMDHEHFQHAEQHYDDQITRLRDEYTTHRQRHLVAQQAIADIQTRINDIEARTKQLPKLHAEASKLLVWQQRLAEITQHIEELTQSIHDTQALVEPAEQARLNQELQRHEQIRQHLSQQQLQNAKAHSQIQLIEQQITTLRLQQHTLAEYTTALARLDQPTPDYQQLLDEGRRITQQITDLQFNESEMQAVRTQIQALRPFRQQYTELQSLDQQLTFIEATITEKAHQAAAYQHTIAQLQATLQQQHQQSETYKQQLADTTCNMSLPAAQMHKTAQAEYTHYQELVYEYRNKLRNIHDAQERLAALNDKIQAENIKRHRYDTLRTAFGRNGIQGMIIEKYAVPALESEANRILAQMSNNQLYLSISMQRQTKSNTTVERLDIVVSDSQGSRQLEAFSGGESFRISFALRIALSKLLAHRAGRRLETLIIDEGFGTQDEAGREHLVDAINSVSAEFKTILVITHIQEVRDLFPVQIAIRHVDNRSTWEILA